MKIKQIIMPVLVCLVLVVATKAATLPFTETFETNSPMAGTLGSVNGQHGWSDPTLNAVVQNTEVWEFDQAVEVSAAELSQSFTDAQTNVWTVFAWKPDAGVLDSADLPSDATVVFWANTNGTLSAYSNQIPVDTGASVSTSAWSRVQVHSDYNAKTWSLWLDGTQVADAFGFYDDTLTDFTEVQFVAEGDATLYVDDVRIGTDAWSPLPGDTDGDGLPDDWELLYFRSPNVSDGTGNEDGDSMTDEDEGTAGTDPTDDTSVFTITDVASDTILDEFTIYWPSVAGRLYSVDGKTNLLEGIGWSNIESNIVATPPTNSYTVPAADDEYFNRIRVKKQ